MIEEKPKFVYTGEKEEFTICWFNINKGLKAKLDANDKFIVTIAVDDARIEGHFTTLMDAVEYAKKYIIAKSFKGQRKYAEGKARILLTDESTLKEFDAGIVIKNITRYYEPVSRFNHNEE